MTEQQEQMIYDEGRRRGKEEATKELMAWHDRVCEEMAKHHTADRQMLDDGTLVVTISDATAVTRVLVEDSKKNGDLYYADRPKGEWIEHKERTIVRDNNFIDFFPTEYECSNCGLRRDTYSINSPLSNYCPNCGADMKGADDE